MKANVCEKTLNKTLFTTIIILILSLTSCQIREATAPADETSDRYPPEKPLSFSAAAGSIRSLDLQWLDASDNEDAFILAYSRNNDYTSAEKIHLEANTQDHSLENLWPGTSYTLWLLALNTAGESQKSSISQQTYGTPPQAMKAPKGPFSFEQSGENLSLSWNDSQDNVLSYYIKTNTNNTDPIDWWLSLAGKTAMFDGLIQNQTYHFWLAASNETGIGPLTNISFTAASFNLALEKQATASSTLNNAGAANHAIDGNLDTRWESEFNDDEWLKIDLGETKQVGRVIIDWQNAHALHYAIELSTDDSNYTRVSQVSNSDGGRDELSFSPQQARYILLDCQIRAGVYGNSLWEMEIQNN